MIHSLATNHHIRLTRSLWIELYENYQRACGGTNSARKQPLTSRPTLSRHCNRKQAKALGTQSQSPTPALTRPTYGISSRTQSDPSKVSSELKSINPNITILSHICNTSNSEDVKHLADIVRSQWDSHLDVVVLMLA